MYKMPSQTQRVTSRLADKTSTARRSKYIRKSRYYINPIKTLKYGKPEIVTLKVVKTLTTNSPAGVGSVEYGLYDLVSDSTDWAQKSNNFALFNILKVQCQIYPTGYDSATFCPGVIAYDPLDQNPLGSISNGINCTNFKYIPFGRSAWGTVYYFSFTPKPVGSVPQRTNDATENFGWIKIYSSGAVNQAAYDMVFIFRLCFTSSQ